jgi:hypothetical protein
MSGAVDVASLSSVTFHRFSHSKNLTKANGLLLEHLVLIGNRVAEKKPIYSHAKSRSQYKMKVLVGRKCIGSLYTSQKIAGSSPDVVNEFLQFT